MLYHLDKRSGALGTAWRRARAVMWSVSWPKEQVIAFLDRLTYGDGSTPETRETQARWREVVCDMWRLSRGELRA